MKLEPDKSTEDSDLPSFIESSPIGKDLLEGQAQERIAESIAHLIKSNRTESNLIGLDGAWGSGKSNLVKILKSKLEKTHHFFIYDAWGHQEDLQRRSFLEELTADLSNSGVVNSRTWNRKLKDLLSKKRETLTKTIPRLSNGVIVTILVALLTLIAQTIAEVTDDPALQILITLIPILIGAAVYLFASWKTRRFLSVSDVYAIYKDEELSSETHVTISEKEPSVREFQDWMNDLSHALTKKKLVVVFDNMDRLPPDKVRELWSSIHTFFAEASFEGIWVIVPFDRNHLSTLFEDKPDVSEEFLRKSFSVIYRVAPPVLTDWRKYFELKFKEAFGEGEEELQYVRKIFDHFQVKITPRSIITFINEMVSLRLIVEREIRLRYIAVFVLAKKTILADPVNRILDGEYLAKVDPIFTEDRDLPDNIAALVYHVPLASASQVTLTREIQNSLQNRDGHRLNELAKHPHFMDILEQVIVEDELDVSSAAYTIAELEEQDSRIVPLNRISNVWDDLCATEIRNLSTEQSFDETHELLLKRCSNSRSTVLANHLVKEIRDADDFSGAKYYEALSELDECIKQNNLSIDMLSMVTEINKSPEIFVDYIGASQSNYRKFKLKCEEAALQLYILEKIPSDLAGLSMLSVVADDYDFTPVIESLESKVKSNSLNAQNVGPFYELYKALSNEQPIKKIGVNLVEQLLSEVKKDTTEQFDLLAMRLAYGNEYPNIGGISHSVLTNTDVDLVNRITERIEYYETYGSLLLSYLSWRQPILKAVLKNITLNVSDNTRLNITKVLKNYNDLQSSLDIAPQDFIGTLDGWSDHAKESITVENIMEHVTDHELFVHGLQIDCDLTHHLIETMTKRLASLSIDEWRQALRDVNSFIFKVTYNLLNGGKLTPVPDNVVTVYRELLTSIAKDEFQMDKDVNDVFYNKIHKAKLKATAKNIRDLFISEITISPRNFLFFSELLLSHGALNEKSADVARRILTPVSADGRCLKFILGNPEQFISILDDAGDDAADFRDTVRQKLMASQDDTELNRFAEAIGIDGNHGS